MSAGPAAAHTELLQASPGPGQRAGGDIDFIDLVFLEPVSSASVEVVHDGEVVPGSMTVTDGSIIRFVFDEALTSSGRYDVTYQMISYDLDDTEDGFFFTFEPEAPQALRIGEPGEVGGRNWLQIGATVVLIASLAGLAFVFLSRLEQRRRTTVTSDEAAPDR